MFFCFVALLLFFFFFSVSIFLISFYFFCRYWADSPSLPLTKTQYSGPTTTTLAFEAKSELPDAATATAQDADADAAHNSTPAEEAQSEEEDEEDEEDEEEERDAEVADEDTQTRAKADAELAANDEGFARESVEERLGRAGAVQPTLISQPPLKRAATAAAAAAAAAAALVLSPNTAAEEELDAEPLPGTPRSTRNQQLLNNTNNNEVKTAAPPSSRAAPPPAASATSASAPAAAPKPTPRSALKSAVSAAEAGAKKKKKTRVKVKAKPSAPADTKNGEAFWATRVFMPALNLRCCAVVCCVLLCCAVLCCVVLGWVGSCCVVVLLPAACLMRTKRVLIEFWARISTGLLTFYSHYGLQISIMVLLIMSFYRSNVLSVFYVFCIIGLYVATAPPLPSAARKPTAASASASAHVVDERGVLVPVPSSAASVPPPLPTAGSSVGSGSDGWSSGEEVPLLARIWVPYTVLVGLSLVFQFLIQIGVPPSALQKYGDFPWVTLTAPYKRYTHTLYRFRFAFDSLSLHVWWLVC
jgi:hypothetical protein